MSALNIAAMSVAYAVCNSRIVIEVTGRIGPGGSYTLLKQWLKQNIGQPAKVPDGVVAIALDNKQRLIRNYLTRADGKVKLDIITNILPMILQTASA